MSMQMDACFSKERIGTLFVWVGALEGGFGAGGGSLRGVHPKKCTCRQGLGWQGVVQQIKNSLLTGARYCFASID
jgi:hypothetical protein